MILTFSVGISKNAKIHMIEGDSDGPHSYNSFLKLCHKCNKKNKKKNKTSKGMIFMKKFKKIIAMGCAVVMAMTTMSIPAMAKEVIEYDNGVVMTIYETEEELDKVMPRTVDMRFSTTLTTSLQYLRSLSTSSYIMTLSDDETELVVTYDNVPSSQFYVTLYDVTTGTTLINDRGPNYHHRAVSFSGLPKKHKFKLGLRTQAGTEAVSGSVNSY